MNLTSLLIPHMKTCLAKNITFIQGTMPMTKTVEKVQKTTTTPNEERLKKLKKLYPECLTEGEVDIEKLKDLLSIKDREANGNERYNFHGQEKVMLSCTSTLLLRQP